MSNDSLDIIIKKMNSLGKELSEKSNHYFKKVINKSEEYTNKGVQQLEIKKLRWKLNKTYSELGEYVYKNNVDDNVVDYSEDEKFILLINRVVAIRNSITQKLKS